MTDRQTDTIHTHFNQLDRDVLVGKHITTPNHVTEFQMILFQQVELKGTNRKLTKGFNNYSDHI